MSEPDNGGEVLRAGAQPFLELHIEPAAAIAGLSLQFPDGYLPFGGLYSGCTKLKNRVGSMDGKPVDQELLKDGYLLLYTRSTGNLSLQLLRRLSQQIVQQANAIFNRCDPSMKKTICTLRIELHPYRPCFFILCNVQGNGCVNQAGQYNVMFF